MSSDFEMGRHDADIQSLKEDVRLIKGSLVDIQATLHETKGGVRMLLTVGSVGGAVGAGVMKMLAYLKGGQ